MKEPQPREKESVMTVVPCTLGKVRDWDTVDDSVHSHVNKKKKKTTNTQASAETISTEFGRKKVLALQWNPHILENEYPVYLKKKEGKVWKSVAGSTHI